LHIRKHIQATEVLTLVNNLTFIKIQPFKQRK